jgi:hypothetical protein
MGGIEFQQLFAADDGAVFHVSEEKVAGTIQAFIEIFSAG